MSKIFLLCWMLLECKSYRCHWCSSLLQSHIHFSLICVTSEFHSNIPSMKITEMKVIFQPCSIAHFSSRSDTIGFWGYFIDEWLSLKYWWNYEWALMDCCKTIIDILLICHQLIYHQFDINIKSMWHWCVYEIYASSMKHIINVTYVILIWNVCHQCNIYVINALM